MQGLAGDISVANVTGSPETVDDKLARRVEFELYSTRAVPLKTSQSVAGRHRDPDGGVASRAEKLLASCWVTQRSTAFKRVVNNT